MKKQSHFFQMSRIMTLSHFVVLDWLDPTLIPFFNVAVAILIPAEKRAYSWYQHMRAHGDPTAINMSFKQVPPFIVKIVNIIQDFLILNVNARCLSVTIFVSRSVAAVSLNPHRI
jgi:hypothetical protein